MNNNYEQLFIELLITFRLYYYIIICFAIVAKIAFTCLMETPLAIDSVFVAMFHLRTALP